MEMKNRSKLTLIGKNVKMNKEDSQLEYFAVQSNNNSLINEKIDKTNKTQNNKVEKELLELIMICLHEEKEKVKELDKEKDKEKQQFLNSVLILFEKNVLDCLLLNNENVIKKLFLLFEKFIFRVPKFISKLILFK